MDSKSKWWETIVDNTSAKQKLESLLKTSILIFVLIEIIIIIVTVEITRWIIKPVIESFSKQKQFVADASHELKTPIAIIMANAEALEKEPEEDINIKCNSSQIKQLIAILIDNAIKHSETNGKISVESEKGITTFKVVLK